MAKFDNVETEVVILKATDGTEATVSIEESSFLDPNTMNMENLNFFFKVDDGEWIEAAKTVNWAKMVENINACAMINRKEEFVNYAGNVPHAQYILDIFEFAHAQTTFCKVNEGTYGYYPFVAMASEASTDGKATPYSFGTNPQNSFKFVEPAFKDIQMEMDVTFKSTEDTPITLVLVNSGYQSAGNVVMGFAETNLKPDNSMHKFYIRFTW